MTGAELRESFLTYFEERSHVRLPSSSLVPSGDSSLLFTNAGMVQFKGIFTGEEGRVCSRAATAQKCLRVSGKHNDLENVGHTARHHTFFEMLGNFSFGDYFKEDAIAFGWEFLTRTIGLPKDKLHVTIFLDDDEAYDIWRRILGPNSNPITRLGEKDNFWSMGDTGPCGPCSEIHIDQGPNLGCGDPNCGPECDCDRFLELWNLVFMQFERDAAGRMTPLPKPSIDTGLGLERLAAVSQGVDSNWETDLFAPIIQRVEDLSGKKCIGWDRNSTAIRVIADHSRASAFLIADGVLPSNEGRGYVLRRILRRALRYGQFVGLHEPFLFDTAGVVINCMSGVYPELSTHRALIDKVVRSEENRFLETLSRGLVLFEEEAARVKSRGEHVLAGSVVFRLYDTFGFPPDLTADLAKESGIIVDHEGFEREMSRQRLMARESWEGMHGRDFSQIRSLVDRGIHTQFTGYETLQDSGTITVILRDGENVSAASPGDVVEIITDRTPFYGESGGQVGDRGTIAAGANEIQVSDTVKPHPNLTVHKGVVREGTFQVGDMVTLSVLDDLRTATMANHSATHLIQWALRKALGEHVSQSGSLVEPSRMRFDFTHFSPISPEELARVEDLVNDRIRENSDITCRTMPLEEARAQGAIALFGEKYGETVRMVSMGDFSKELCGGTHAKRTGDLGLFKIISEGGIAAGVRRIEAVTGRNALRYVNSMEEELKQLSAKLKGGRGELVKKVDRLIEEKKNIERDLENMKLKMLKDQTGDILDGIRVISGVKILSRVVEDVSTPKDLREYADRVKARMGSGIALLGAKADGKALIIAVVTGDLSSKYHAGNIVKKAAMIVGGTGGGRADMAQAGGPKVDALESALKSVESFLE